MTNGNGFSILVKNESVDVATDTLLNLFKEGFKGDFCDGESSTWDKTDHCWISKRQKHWILHMTDLFTRCKDITSCPLTKQNHLGKCSNGKLRTSTLVNDGTLTSISDFASALSNVKMLIMLKMLWYLICLCCLKYCCFPLFFLTRKSFAAEVYTSRKLEDCEHTFLII